MKKLISDKTDTLDSEGPEKTRRITFARGAIANTCRVLCRKRGQASFVALIGEAAKSLVSVYSEIPPRAPSLLGSSTPRRLPLCQR